MTCPSPTGCAGVVAIDIEAAVEQAGRAPSTMGELAASAGKMRKHQANRRVQPPELVVAAKRQVDVHALQVRPAVPRQSKMRSKAA